MQPVEQLFRRLTAGDPALIAAIGNLDARSRGIHRLDERTETLLRIGALVALDAPQSSFQVAVDSASRAGVDVDDIAAILVAVAGTVGSARIVSAAPRIALAAGYDVEAAEGRLDRYEP